MDLIECPFCKKEFELDKALYAHIKNEASNEIKAEFKEKEMEFKKKKDEFSIKEEQLKNREKDIDKEINEKLKIEKNKIEKEKEKWQEENLLELEKIEEEQKKKSLELTKIDELLKKKDEEQIKKEEELKEEALKIEKIIEDERKRIGEEKDLKYKIKYEKKLDKDREKNIKKAYEEVEKKYNLETKEKDKIINNLTKEIKELKSRTEQIQPATKGEVLEDELENILIQKFIKDKIERVEKGERGCDIKHYIVDEEGNNCGLILWEAKRAKKWSNNWVNKLKKDIKDCNANKGIIVTTSLPPSINNFGSIDDNIWVTDIDSFLGLAIIIRGQLIEVSIIKNSMKDQKLKENTLINYISGSEFRNRVTEIGRDLSDMITSLKNERKHMEDYWKKRKEHIETVFENISMMFGKMKGIVGSSYPELQKLELKALPEK
jgi:hypothetical protein